MNENQRDALLVRLDERTARLARLIEGNGRPGIVSDVAANKQEIDDLKEELQNTKALAQSTERLVPSAQERQLVGTGVLASLIVAVYSAWIQITQHH